MQTTMGMYNDLGDKLVESTGTHGVGTAYTICAVEPDKKEVKVTPSAIVNYDLIKEKEKVVKEPKMISLWNAVVITVLVALVVLFATMTYRNEQVISLTNQALLGQQYYNTIVKTNDVLNQVRWDSNATKIWTSLGYQIKEWQPAPKDTTKAKAK